MLLTRRHWSLPVTSIPPDLSSCPYNFFIFTVWARCSVFYDMHAKVRGQLVGFVLPLGWVLETRLRSSDLVASVSLLRHFELTFNLLPSSAVLFSFPPSPNIHTLLGPARVQILDVAQRSFC